MGECKGVYDRCAISFENPYALRICGKMAGKKNSTENGKR
jgi:hypothetical protein